MNTEGRIIQDGRDASVDIVKGMAILLVVYAHTWPIFRNFYRLFCLQLFLVASGYCTRGRIESPADWRRYMGRRMRALYIPCAVCNGIYALLGYATASMPCWGASFCASACTRTSRFSFR